MTSRILPRYSVSPAGEAASHPLSAKCLKRITYVASLIEEINLAAVQELHTLDRMEVYYTNLCRGQNLKPRVLISQDERDQIEESKAVIAQKKGLASTSSVDEILESLCNNGDVPLLRLVCTAMSRIQNNYIEASPLDMHAECRNRAQVFLDHGASIVNYLHPVKAELQIGADEVLFALRFRLTAIESFAPLYTRLTRFEIQEKQDKIPVHRFMALKANFDLDDLTSDTGARTLYTPISTSSTGFSLDISRAS